MIKAGDKVVCIKSTNLNNHENFIKGNIYEIYQANIYQANITDVHIYIKPGGVKFFINNFDKYFITLAEWREQQINSILDEL